MGWTIAQYREQYALADSFCQEVQSFRNEAGIPAMNELRNAGHHLLKALDDGGAVSDQTHLDNAVGHARRAIYEATEAGIVTCLASVDKFRHDYASIELITVVPDYTAQLKCCHGAQKLLETGRVDDFDRSEDHQNRMEVFRTLRGFVESLDIAREDANKKVASERRDSRRFIITTVIGALAVVVVVLFGIWSVYGNKRFWEHPPGRNTDQRGAEGNRRKG